jgi:hypothetical protein
MMEHEPWSADVLDWIAAEFIREKYDLKKLLYLITTSQAYQRAAVIRHEPLETKPYAFTGPEIRRLTAEQFVDAISDLEITKPTDVARHRAWEAENNRLMTMLGRPSRDVVVTSRNNESTTLLQLELINGKLLEDAVSRAADAQLNAFGSFSDIEKRIYRVLLGRDPKRRERLLTVNADDAPFTRNAVSDLIWTIIMLPEFQLLQ